MQLRQSGGFSLVELMVAMVAGLLLVAAVSALFATIIRANSTAMKVSRLNQELQSVTDMIARDIQRAGYDASAAQHTLVSGATSPFNFNPTTDLIGNNCIWIKYDDNANGALENTPGAGEIRVYNYNSSDKSVRLDPGITASCSAGDQISSEDTIEISALSFTLSGSVSTGARTIRLAITGNDKKDTALKLSLQRDIKLRNDGY